MNSSQSGGILFVFGAVFDLPRSDSWLWAVTFLVHSQLQHFEIQLRKMPPPEKSSPFSLLEYSCEGKYKRQHVCEGELCWVVEEEKCSA